MSVVRGLSLMLGGMLLGQLADPGQQKTNQPEASRITSGEPMVVLPGSPGEAARCTREVLRAGQWTVVRANPEELRAFRYLPADELERLARSRGPNEMRWSRARVDLYLNFTKAEPKVSRVGLRLRILAEAEPSAPVLRPTNLFSLASTGALEGELITALKARCAAEAKPCASLARAHRCDSP
jgi:hypothetical protein